MVNFVAEGINNLLHLPFIEDVLCYLFWIFAWIAQIFFAADIVLRDIFSGFLFSLRRVDPSPDKAVFITGCDQGFGRALAIRLVQQGYKVYASCLTTKAINELCLEYPKLHTLQLDVTNENEVADAAEKVRLENPQGLYALVNNAGVAKLSPVDWHSLDDYRFVMDVNYFGLVSVTKAFLPLLKKTQGRIVCMSSAAGISCGVPFSSAYSCSKHAVENFTSCLRQELPPWGIKVSTINPGFTKTDMAQYSADQIPAAWNKLPQDLKQQYGEVYRDACTESVRKSAWNRAFEAKHVINAMEHAVCAKHPRVQYLVGLDMKLAFCLFQMLPKRVGERLTYMVTHPWKMRYIPGLKDVTEDHAPMSSAQ